MFDRYSSTAANVMTKRRHEKGVWRAWDHVENHFFPFIVYSIIEIKVFKNTSWNLQKYSFCVFLSPGFSQTSWFSKSTKKVEPKQLEVFYGQKLEGAFQRWQKVLPKNTKKGLKMLYIQYFRRTAWVSDFKFSVENILRTFSYHKIEDLLQVQ